MTSQLLLVEAIEVPATLHESNGNVQPAWANYHARTQDPLKEGISIHGSKNGGRTSKILWFIFMIAGLYIGCSLAK